MSEFYIDEGSPVLVDFALSPEFQQGTYSPEDIAAKSSQALDMAMNTIHHMARRVVSMKDQLSLLEQPTMIEVEFGLKLDAHAGALIAQTGDDASINITLTWERDDDYVDDDDDDDEEYYNGFEDEM